MRPKRTKARQPPPVTQAPGAAGVAAGGRSSFALERQSRRIGFEYASARAVRQARPAIHFRAPPSEEVGQFVVCPNLNVLSFTLGERDLPLVSRFSALVAS